MTTKDFPSTIEDVSASWLTGVLQGSGFAGVEITDMQVGVIGEGVGIMGLLYRVELSYSDSSPKEAPSSVVIKVPSPHEQTRHIARAFMFYGKEIGFYRDAAKDTPLGTPKCYAAYHDPESDDFVLVLEDLDGTEVISQLDGCPLDKAEIAIDALARHHAAFWESERFDGDLSWLPYGWDVPFPQAIAQGFSEAWPSCMEMFPNGVSDRVKKVGEKFPTVTSEMMELADSPITLAHGDFRLDNLFFENETLKVIDWQICIKTVGGYDLGYFLSQSLTIEDRRNHEIELLDRYRNTLSDMGLDYPQDRLMEDYRRSVLFCLAYPVQASAAALVNERAVQLVTEMFARVSTAIEDLDADEFLPE
ncbi:MAG: oxidoreductase family protein [Actinomycetota bacterium]|nr:oxidoreductase family protein [Actinomycetota bacterium]